MVGKVKDFKLITPGMEINESDSEPDVSVKFEKGEIIFLSAKGEKYSYNSVEIVADNGRLRYENSGHYIEWYNIKKDNKNIKNYIEEIPNELNLYQWHVVEQLSKALKNEPAYLCDGIQALQTFEEIKHIFDSRK